MKESELFSAKSDRLSDYLSWLGMLVGFGAIFLGWVAVQALRQNAAARREAETEGERAEALEQAVAEATSELRTPTTHSRPKRRNAWPPKRSSARSRRWKRSAS